MGLWIADEERGLLGPGAEEPLCAAPLCLCAIEHGDISTGLYQISVRGVVTELRRLPGLPGALLPLPGGELLVGALGTLLILRHDGRLLRRFPCGLPARLRLCRQSVLCADPLEGRLLRVPLREGRPEALYTGGAPADGMDVE